MRRRLLKSFAGLAVLGFCAAAALSGPQQALASGWNGLDEIAPGVWSDTPARTDEFTAILATSAELVAAFYGVRPEPARIILCATNACAARFIGRHHPSGMTYGAELVVLAPKGLQPLIAAHELAHVALHGRMNAFDLLRPRFPTWFDEGLARALVEETVAVDGVEGLRALIDRVSAGADFDTERAALLAQVEPG